MSNAGTRHSAKRPRNRWAKNYTEQGQGHISDLGAEAYGLSTAEFTALVDADIKKWGDAVKASGATAD
ncbi:hypothetical protein N5D37_14815 [Comamonas aquatica]|uniref:hypothetical protein n=1 Tax=Comamonas aquatica TaxID=225991 RepID=UPI0024485BCD|nr:hypothetical protein [Comamonas aquatica]MDH1766882.1 hypothetical protein [Comamonas aquatica]